MSAIVDEWIDALATVLMLAWLLASRLAYLVAGVAVVGILTRLLTA